MTAQTPDHLDIRHKMILEIHGLSTTTPTDLGLPCGDIEPLGDVCLSPNDPVPVGRGPEGDLAYAFDQRNRPVNITCEQAATLAHLLARHIGLEDPEAIRVHMSTEWLVRTLLNAAAPRCLFGDSTHEVLLMKQTHKNILEQGAEALPQNRLDTA